MQSVLRSSLLSRHGFSHGFSTRSGGVSPAPFESLNLGRSVGDEPEHVAENHRRFAARVGYEPARIFELSQVHGRRARQVEAHEDASEVRREEGDALLTAAAGVAIGIRAADCLPLLIGDPETGAVAAVHSGWRGTSVGVGVATVEALLQRSAVPASRLCAAIFPHIRACCFEVGDEVAETLAAVVSDREVIVRGHDKPHVDLARVVRAQLTAAGMDAALIDDVPGCTRCEPERFFSYRREGQRSGRHLAVIIAR